MPTLTDRELERLTRAVEEPHKMSGSTLWTEVRVEDLRSLLSSYEERGRALASFAKIADYWTDDTPETDPVLLCDREGTLDERLDLTVADFRKARSLSPTPGGGE